MPGCCAWLAINGLICTQGVDRGHIFYDGLTGFKIDGAMNIHTIPPTALSHRDGHLFRRPDSPPIRTVWVGCTASAKTTTPSADSWFEQALVGLDEGFLLRRIQLAGDGFRLAMFQTQPVQERDEAGSGLVRQSRIALRSTRRPNAPCVAGSRLSMFSAGFVAPTVNRQTPPFVAETCQTFDPVLLIQLVLGSDRVIVEKQHLGDGHTVHSIVKQHQGIGAPGQAVRNRARHASVRTGRVGIPGSGSEGGSCTDQNCLTTKWQAISTDSRRSRYIKTGSA